ncbi:hypothetical protein [Streptomyces minutiscleroticus]
MPVPPTRAACGRVQVTDRRYLSEGSMAQVAAGEPVAAPALTGA